MRKLVFAAIAVFSLSLIGMAASLAQPNEGWGPRGGWGSGMMMGPGMMMGSGMMSWRGPGLCQGRTSQMAMWRMERLEQIVRPTAAQKPAMDELRNALNAAAERTAAGCPSEFPKTMSARLELMENRMESMVASIKSVRPAFDKFYASLDEEQKARLDNAGPRRWGWSRNSR